MDNYKKALRTTKKQHLKDLRQDPEYMHTKHLRYRAEVMANCTVDGCVRGQEHSDILVDALENELSNDTPWIKKTLCKTFHPIQLRSFHRKAKDFKARTGMAYPEELKPDSLI